jgi:hypothetical protein
MEARGIEHVTARIREIQSRVQQPALPGDFKAMLERQMASSNGTGRNAETSHVHHHGGHNIAMAAWPSVSATTLGAMLGLPTVGPTTAVPGQVTTYPTVQLPPFPGIATHQELQSYLVTHNIEARNGKLGAGELVEISGGWHPGAKLIPPAASAWEEMRAAAAADGIDLRVIDSYRTWESQARAHEAHLRGEKKANVLPPGTSEHGNGLAVDVTNGAIVGTDDPEWHWLKANATRFGWYPISNETWHWEFRGTGV